MIHPVLSIKSEEIKAINLLFFQDFKIETEKP